MHQHVYDVRSKDWISLSSEVDNLGETLLLTRSKSDQNWPRTEMSNKADILDGLFPIVTVKAYIRPWRKTISWNTFKLLQMYIQIQNHRRQIIMLHPEL